MLGPQSTLDGLNPAGKMNHLPCCVGMSDAQMSQPHLPMIQMLVLVDCDYWMILINNLIFYLFMRSMVTFSLQRLQLGHDHCHRMTSVFYTLALDGARKIPTYLSQADYSLSHPPRLQELSRNGYALEVGEVGRCSGMPFSEKTPC